MIAPGFEKLDGKVKDLRNKIKKSGSAGRQAFEKDWYRNCLFFAGTQWISFNKSLKKWVEAKVDDWAPRPVTNKFAAAVRTIKSIITQQEPRILIRPDTDDEKDVATAEIGDSIAYVLDKESDMEEVRKSSASWGVITGNAFAYTYYDTSDEHGTTDIELDQCNGCKAVHSPDDIVDAGQSCPDCGSKDLGPAMDDQANRIKTSYPKGKLTTETRSPFEAFFNGEVQDFYKLREVVLSKTVSVEELQMRYPEFKDKIIPLSGNENQLSEYYLSSLAYVTNSAVSGINVTPSMNAGSEKIEKNILDEVFALPRDGFPDGLYAVLIGDAVVESRPLWSKTKKGKYFIPIAHFGAIDVPGRLWHKAPVDDLVKKQLQRNKYESLIELSLLRMGSADWLIPTGTDSDEPTGEPGQKVKYKPGPRGEKPERIPGMPVNQSIFQMIEMIDKDFEELAATYDALKGQVPTGMKAFSGLKLLTERGYSTHIELIRNWEDYQAKIKLHQLEIARQHFTEPRLRTISNKNGSWETKEFTAADLEGSIDISVEAGSSRPKSQALEQAMLLDLQQMGLIDTSNPATHYKMMEKLGEADMMEGTDIDVKDAGREWQDFLASVEDYQQAKNGGDTNALAFLKLRFREEIDNHAIHDLDHVLRAKSPEFFALPPEIQQEWIDHDKMHKAFLMQQQTPQPAPGNAPPPKINAELRTKSLAFQPAESARVSPPVPG